MEHITLNEMLEMEVKSILNMGNRDFIYRYFYKNGENEYREIVELDLMRGRFVTDNGDFSEFHWELEESHIYREKMY